MTFAYFTLLIFALLNVGCAAYAKKLAGFTPADNKNPRDFMAHLTGKAARLHAAQLNGYEIFAPYTAAVLVAHATGEASQAAINFFALVFILTRMGYIWCYAQDKSVWRSINWGIGLLCIIALFVIAF